jgi:hypothetical protein
MARIAKSSTGALSPTDLRAGRESRAAVAEEPSGHAAKVGTQTPTTHPALTTTSLDVDFFQHIEAREMHSLTIISVRTRIGSECLKSYTLTSGQASLLYGPLCGESDFQRAVDFAEDLLADLMIRCCQPNRGPYFSEDSRSFQTEAVCLPQIVR